ncbi:hypothetical protein BH160DRAFT_7414 [Burkholderia sp. H160]|nr:hypothetical protein BH160DRAFT_7414 [Burkholderia sp. H160]
MYLLFYDKWKSTGSIARREVSATKNNEADACCVRPRDGKRLHKRLEGVDERSVLAQWMILQQPCEYEGEHHDTCGRQIDGVQRARERMQIVVAQCFG